MENRLYQRIPIQVSATVITEQGERIEVVAVDLSSEGLGIECSTRQRNTITPSGSFLRNGKLLELLVEFKLYDEVNALSKNTVKCRVVFSRRLSSEQCKIGFRFVDIDDEFHERLIQLIDRAKMLNISRK
ncbi:MAG: PilZ domain-containing protein [Methylobacter sp.]|nr:PilZ domain-containing protein [Methylobacter sp.]